MDLGAAVFVGSGNGEIAAINGDALIYIENALTIGDTVGGGSNITQQSDGIAILGICQCIGQTGVTYAVQFDNRGFTGNDRTVLVNRGFRIFGEVTRIFKIILGFTIGKGAAGNRHIGSVTADSTADSTAGNRNLTTFGLDIGNGTAGNGNRAAAAGGHITGNSTAGNRHFRAAAGSHITGNSTAGNGGGTAGRIHIALNVRFAGDFCFAIGNIHIAQVAAAVFAALQGDRTPGNLNDRMVAAFIAFIGEGSAQNRDLAISDIEYMVAASAVQTQRTVVNDSRAAGYAHTSVSAFDHSTFINGNITVRNDGINTEVYAGEGTAVQNRRAACLVIQAARAAVIAAGTDICSQEGTAVDRQVAFIPNGSATVLIAGLNGAAFNGHHAEVFNAPGGDLTVTRGILQRESTIVVDCIQASACTLVLINRNFLAIQVQSDIDAFLHHKGLGQVNVLRQLNLAACSERCLQVSLITNGNSLLSRRGNTQQADEHCQYDRKGRKRFFHLHMLTS